MKFINYRRQVETMIETDSREVRKKVDIDRKGRKDKKGGKIELKT